MSTLVYVRLSSVGLGTGNGFVRDAERGLDRAVPTPTVTMFGVVPHVPATLLGVTAAGYRVALPGGAVATVAKVRRINDEPTLSA